MEYLEQLREIDSEVFSNMGKVSQITIDMVQETIKTLDRDLDEEPIERDELGAVNYDIGILLEVFNPEKEYDIDLLKRFDKIIENWYNDIEFRNKALGIPWNKG